MENTPQISIIIVTYKVKAFLTRCLESLSQTSKNVTYELIIIDNDSNDGTVEFVCDKYPQAKLIKNSRNVGFGRACNQGIKQAQGSTLLFLNPDTLLQSDTLEQMLHFFNRHPKAGVVGPKILNSNGQLQLACRRSFPTPFVALCKFFGLGFLFPKSRVFGRYNLTYLDPRQETEVDAVSGSCFMARKQPIVNINGFDEDFFMYGEDLDLFFRISSAGWKVFYTPSTTVVHVKGASSRSAPLRSVTYFYNAMYLFSRKHITTRYRFLPRWLLYVGILLNGFFGVGKLIARNLHLVLIDLLILNIGLWAFMTLWFIRLHGSSPYGFPIGLMLMLHAIFSLIWTLSLGFLGSYRGMHAWVGNSFKASIISSIVSLSVVYLIQYVAFSRAAFLMTSASCTILLPLWRLAADKLGSANVFTPRNRAIIVGNPEQIALTIGSLRKNRKLKIAGYLSKGEPASPPEGIRCLGKPGDISRIIRNEKIDEIIIFESEISYGRLIEIIASSVRMKPTIRMASFTNDMRLLLTDIGTSSIVSVDPIQSREKPA